MGITIGRAMPQRTSCSRRPSHPALRYGFPPGWGSLREAVLDGEPEGVVALADGVNVSVTLGELLLIPLALLELILPLQARSESTLRLRSGVVRLSAADDLKSEILARILQT